MFQQVIDAIRAIAIAHLMEPLRLIEGQRRLIALQTLQLEGMLAPAGQRLQQVLANALTLVIRADKQVVDEMVRFLQGNEACQPLLRINGYP